MKENKNTEKQGRRRATPRQAKAGTDNLIAYRARVNGRPALKSGIHAALNGHIADVPGGPEIAAQVDAVVGEMVSDLGGLSELTGQRKGILESQRMCLLVLGLANSFIRREGLLNRKGKPHPLLSTVVSFANTLRLNAVVLGLERRARRVGPTNLAEYLESKNREKTEAPPVETESTEEQSQ